MSGSPPQEDPPRAAQSPGTTGAAGRHLGRRLLVWGVFLLSIVAGVFFWRPIVGGLASLISSPQPQGEVLYWVSPMDPSLRSDKPGKDSMGMDLVPVYAGEQPPPQPVLIDPVLQENEYVAGTVENGPLVRTIDAIGTVTYAEPLIGDVTLKIDAWIEKLYVDYLGQPVRKGQPLFDIYSPALVDSQQELLISRQALTALGPQADAETRREAEQNVESARERLRYWDLTDRQIDDLVKAGKVQKTVTFYSPYDGIVTEKMAFEGEYMKAGSMLYRIADLSKVWVYLYVYQNQIHCVYEGQGATMTLANLPGHEFHGRVVYIYPYLEPKIRAVKVRLEFDNPELILKPDMFAQVVLEPHRMGDGLKIARRAILDTGTRQLVYLALPDDKFAAREVTTGMELDGGKIEVLSGLTAGERIVLSEQFLVDSESRLRLVNRKFLEPAATSSGMVPVPYGMPDMQRPNASK